MSTYTQAWEQPEFCEDTAWRPHDRCNPQRIRNLAGRSKPFQLWRIEAVVCYPIAYAYCHVIPPPSLPLLNSLPLVHWNTAPTYRTLDTSPAEFTARPLHFVTYVPPADECPLRLLLPDGTPSPINAFHVPGWGGVVVWNPPTCRGGGGGDGEGAGGRSAGVDGVGSRADGEDGGEGRPTYLSGADLEAVMEATAGQLRVLLGLPPSSPKGTIRDAGTEAGEGAGRAGLGMGRGTGSRTNMELEVRSVAAAVSGFATWQGCAPRSPPHKATY